MILFADLHLKESTEGPALAVLDEVYKLAQHDDKHVVFCGDFWHLRYQVSVRLLNLVRERLDRWVLSGLQVDLVPGNHDQVTIDGVNALEVLRQGDVIRVWTQPGVREGLGFVPYRKDQAQQAADLQKVAFKARMIFGHFGVSGSTMDGGRQDVDGLQLAPGGPLMFLGHYHRHQTGHERGLNYVYVGSPYQQSFGEVGNIPGVLRCSGAVWSFVPLDVGPSYWVLTWDLDVSPEPPPRPTTWRQGDKVRLDVKAAYSQLANPKLLKGLADVGLGEAQINILPRDERRDHRLAMVPGESLGQTAERYARSRLGDAPEEDKLKRLEYLKRWSAEEVGR